MNPEIAAKLRAPFPDDVVGYLPRVWCKACRDSGRNRTCGQHSAARCRKCQNTLTTAHVDLSYIGHAETTDRLLQVDPGWHWEPVAFGPDGLPLLDRHNGLWIRLTVAGVTRLGYGHPDGKTGPDAIKEAIGDAIRNAAMRFGVALDLWGATFKGDDEPEPPGEAPTVSTEPSEAAREALSVIAEAATREDLSFAWAKLRELSKDGRLTRQEANLATERWTAKRDELTEDMTETAGVS